MAEMASRMLKFDGRNWVILKQIKIAKKILEGKLRTETGMHCEQTRKQRCYIVCFVSQME